MAMLNRLHGKGRVLKRMIILALSVFVIFFSVHIFSGRQIVAITADSTPVVKTMMVVSKTDTIIPDTLIAPVPLPATTSTQQINVGKTDPVMLVNFAETLLGTPYVYASSDPKTGFDCSGFITYVFKHFGIEVPRSSIDFTSVGKTVTVENAKQGDLILFTGTNEFERNIGHMGLVVSNDPMQGLSFIHATSGKAMSVTISPLNEQYKKRFIRIGRIFAKNG